MVNFQMILRLYPRLWLCRPLDCPIIVRALATSSDKSDQGNPSTSRTFDLRVKLKAAEGKDCDKLKQSDRLTQEHIEVEEVFPSVDGIVKRDPILTLIKRLEQIDKVEEQEQNHSDSMLKGDNTGQSSLVDSEQSLTQCDTWSKVIPGEGFLENEPKRVLTPVTMRIPEGLEKTIEVFRDFPDQYPFLRLV